MTNEHPGKTDIKDLFHVIKKSPAIMIVLGVGVVVIIYLAWKNNQNNAAATTTTLPSSLDSSGLAGSQLPGSYYLPQEAYVQTPNITLTVPPSTPPPINVLPVPSPTATVPSADPFFAKGFEVIQKSKNGKNTWSVYDEQTKVSTLLSNLFPKGTIFSGGSTGQAFYTLPDSSNKLALSQVGYYGHQHVG